MSSSTIVTQTRREFETRAIRITLFISSNAGFSSHHTHTRTNTELSDRIFFRKTRAFSSDRICVSQTTRASSWDRIATHNMCSCWDRIALHTCSHSDRIAIHTCSSNMTPRITIFRQTGDRMRSELSVRIAFATFWCSPQTRNIATLSGSDGGETE